MMLDYEKYVKQKKDVMESRVSITKILEVS